jgi:POT family proton-dependent oligopeptide transporter
MSSNKTFFGHPYGLATLFFTEMWERFSYYGMRALLVLYMVTAVEKGGMGIDDKTSGAIYGLYTMFVYLLALPGGWLADNFFGLRKAVFYGGCIITLGHFCMAFNTTETFFIGLLLIAIGTGFLKPNISSMVGELYPSHEQAKRDAGFSLFYMGINLGAFISPLIVGYIGENINWHYGFAVAGIGMFLGLVQYKLTEKSLGNAGLYPTKASNAEEDSKREKTIRTGLWIVGIALIILVVLLVGGIISIDPIAFAQVSGYIIAIAAVLYFVYVFIAHKLSSEERNKMIAIVFIFIVTVMFYTGYEGQGSTLNLFAKRYTDMMVGSFEMPASWMQSLPAVFVLLFVPIFAWLWVRLANTRVSPSTPVKTALGLIFMGLGYVVMMGASMIVINGGKPLPTWLITTYLLHTFGEICLYPIGLSAVTKLSPQRLVGQMMGVFFMALAMGNLFAGLYSGNFDEASIAANPNLLVELFGFIAKMMLGAALVVLIFNKLIRKLMGDIR